MFCKEKRMQRTRDPSGRYLKTEHKSEEEEEESSDDDIRDDDEWANAASSDEEEQAFSVPSNVRNSCFMDATLVALLMVPNRWVTDQVLTAKIPVQNIPSALRFQTRLRRLARRMRIKGYTPSKLAKRVAKIRNMFTNGRYHALSTESQQDTSEFLAAIASILDLQHGVNTQSVIIEGTNELGAEPPRDRVITSARIEDAGITHTVFAWSRHEPVTSLLTRVNDSGQLDRVYSSGTRTFARTITTSSFIPGPFFTVHLDRASVPTVNRTPVRVQERIYLAGREYTLHGVVMHTGQSIRRGHYTCLARLSDGQYSQYDDLLTSLTVPAPFETMAKCYQVDTTCVLLFYTQSKV
jgi:hypothetical protein